MIQPILEHKIWINAPSERVWRAITESEQIGQWWGAPGYAEITELQVGTSIKFGTEDGPIFATIRVVDPPHEFVYEWPRIQDTSPFHSSQDIPWMKKTAALA